MATPTLVSPSHLSDNDLLAEVSRLAACERHATAALIASLAELDSRRLYLGQGFSSLFTYCTQALHLSEHAAYGRIEAARAARRFPIILDLLADGSINITIIGLLAPQLTEGNHRDVLKSAQHKSKRDVEHLVARLRPQPDVATAVRKLPPPKASDVPHPSVEERTVCSETTPQLSRDVPADRPAIVRPSAPERYKVQFTVSGETYLKLRRVQDLMRHSVPNGDPAVIFDRALTELLAILEKKKLAITTHPRAARESARQSRHIPAAVRREVWQRDDGRCAFVGTHGRCSETGFLEFHHVRPFAVGGETIVSNIELRCRAHNAYEAEQHFGPLFVREDRAEWIDQGLGLDRVLRLARTSAWRGRRASCVLPGTLLEDARADDAKRAECLRRKSHVFEDSPWSVRPQTDVEDSAVGLPPSQESVASKAALDDRLCSASVQHVGTTLRSILDVRPPASR